MKIPLALLVLFLPTICLAQGNPVGRVSAEAVRKCIYAALPAAHKQRLVDKLKSGNYDAFNTEKQSVDTFPIARNCDPRFSSHPDTGGMLSVVAQEYDPALDVLARKGLTRTKLDAVKGPDVDPIFSIFRAIARREKTPAALPEGYMGRLVAPFGVQASTPDIQLALFLYYRNREILAVADLKMAQ